MTRSALGKSEAQFRFAAFASVVTGSDSWLLTEPESSPHLASASSRDSQGAAVQILDYPFSSQRDAEESRADRPADMRPVLTPVDASKRETAAQCPGRPNVDPKSLKHLFSTGGQFVGVRTG